MGHVTLTTYRTRRSPSEISLLYNTTFLCVFLNADKLLWERKISPFYLFTWIFIDFRVSTSEFTGTLWTRNSEKPTRKIPTSALRRLRMRTRTSLCDVINQDGRRERVGVERRSLFCQK